MKDAREEMDEMFVQNSKDTTERWRNANSNSTQFLFLLKGLRKVLKGGVLTWYNQQGNVDEFAFESWSCFFNDCGFNDGQWVCVVFP